MKSIIISDIHLGIDDRTSGCVKNRDLLISFLEKIIREKVADEVVINGDFLDQWFYPPDRDVPTDSQEFFKIVAANNQEVMVAFQKLLRTGIGLVYVPGNHDMTLEATTLEEILPGIKQAREVRGMGRYYTGERNEIVIEHSHRYELSCAPDIFSNKEHMRYGDPILPHSYFYARVGQVSEREGFPAHPQPIEEITKPDNNDDDQMAAYAYFKNWQGLVNFEYPINESFDEKFLHIAVDGFHGDFSLADLVPHMKEERISANLFPDLQRTWYDIQQHNLVNVPFSARYQLEHPIEQEWRIDLARTQYFDFDPTIDVVVFGHSHVPAYRTYHNGYKNEKIFVNDGSWIDNNFSDQKNTATFALIESSARETHVDLLKCVGDANGFDIQPVKNQYT